jgi:Mn-dependent DtxR family transcriptional regulator
MTNRLHTAVFLLLALPLCQLTGQIPDDKVRIAETSETMSAGMNNALIVTLEAKSKKLAENVWRKFMEDYGGKTKRAKGGDEYLTTVEIVGINGVKPINIYTRAQASEEDAQSLDFIVWFDLGEEYLSSTWKTQYQEAEKLLAKYAHACKVESTDEELEEAGKKLRSMQNDLERLERQHSGYEKDIADAEKRIVQARENIAKNVQQRGDTMQKIDLQKQLLEEIERRLNDLKKN